MGKHLLLYNIKKFVFKNRQARFLLQFSEGWHNFNRLFGTGLQDRCIRRAYYTELLTELLMENCGKGLRKFAKGVHFARPPLLIKNYWSELPRVHVIGLQLATQNDLGFEIDRSKVVLKTETQKIFDKCPVHIYLALSKNVVVFRSFMWKIKYLHQCLLVIKKLPNVRANVFSVHYRYSYAYG